MYRNQVSLKKFFRKEGFSLTNWNFLEIKASTTVVCISEKEEYFSFFVDKHIQIQWQKKRGCKTPNLRIGLMKNAPTQVLVIFVFIVTLATNYKATVAYRYM